MFVIDAPTHVDRLSEARDALREAAHAVDPWEVPLAEAKTMLGVLVAAENVAASLKSRLARRIAEAGEWERAGFSSPEGWLAHQTGTAPGRARELLETARRLDHLPGVTEAANRGDLSVEQTAVIAEAATADPSTEERLLGSARAKPLSQLRDECAAIKRAADPDPEAAHRRLHVARRLQFGRAMDGAARLMGATTPEQMAVIKAAVERRGNQLFDEARRAGRREPREAYLMDALAQICDEWLRGAEPQALEAGDVVPRRQSASVGYLGLLRLDVAALQRGHATADELCEITGVGPVPVSVARRLLSDAVLKLVLTRGVDVVNVTHLGRGPTAAQRAALLWTSPGCVVASCPRMAGIQHDHRLDWASTRHTVLGELDRLCDHHHDLKTRKGWALITHHEGVAEMVPPHDPRHPGTWRPQDRAGPSDGAHP